MTENNSAHRYFDLILNQINPSKLALKPDQNINKDEVIFSLRGAKKAIIDELKHAVLAATSDPTREQLIKRSFNINAGLLDEVREMRSLPEYEKFNLIEIIDFAEQTLIELQEGLLEKYKFELAGYRSANNTDTLKEQAAPLKVLVGLSGDQIALLLRASQENGLLQARSVTAVFNIIVPYLSTPQQESLSPTLRSKAYQGEDRDKNILVETLEKLIESIKAY